MDAETLVIISSFLLSFINVYKKQISVSCNACQSPAYEQPEGDYRQ